ncbi:hypothetical protein ACFR97_13805 [Haloplanus litoreus]|uniref:Uncharacterized protein n=1 Tax=Haloplanus litoreus TaxID=767515 RepID=A0ABD5ZXH8_9EURY
MGAPVTLQRRSVTAWTDTGRSLLEPIYGANGGETLAVGVGVAAAAVAAAVVVDLLGPVARCEVPKPFAD